MSNTEYTDKPIINEDYIFATWMATTQDLKNATQVLRTISLIKGRFSIYFASTTKIIISSKDVSKRGNN